MSISGLLQNILASNHDDIYIYIKISKNILSIPTKKNKSHWEDGYSISLIEYICNT